MSNIKYYANGIYNAPQTHVDSPILRRSVAGSYIQLLRAVLVTGYGLRTVQSITVDSVGIATVSCVNHGILKPLIYLQISGALDEAYNTEWRVTQILDANTFLLDMSAGTIRSDIILGSTITIKVAPLNWAERFKNDLTYTAVFQSLSSTGVNPYLKIKDSMTTAYAYAEVKMIESMDGIGINEVNICPKVNALLWGRDSPDNGKQYSNPENVGWVLIGNEKLFYLIVHVTQTSYRPSVPYMFGELHKIFASDTGNCVLMGSIGGNTSDYYQNYYDFSHNDWRATVLKPISQGASSNDIHFRIRYPQFVASNFGRTTEVTAQNKMLYVDTVYWCSSDDTKYNRGVITGLGFFGFAVSNPTHGAILQLNGANYLLLSISTYYEQTGGHILINLDSWA